MAVDAQNGGVELKIEACRVCSLVVADRITLMRNRIRIWSRIEASGYGSALKLNLDPDLH
jgi:hypothetical protein